MPRPKWRKRLRWVIALVALMALATLPIGWRSCRSEARAREADKLMRYLVQQVKRVHAGTGALPRQAAGPTPAIGACCEQGGRCAVDTTQWTLPTWRALAFTIDDPHRFSYSYQPTQTGAVLRAVGDVDCDGQPSVVEVMLTLSPSGIVEKWSRQAPGE